MKVIASSLRKGNVVEMDGKLYAVLKAENFHPGKGTPTTSVDMRRISDGVKVSERWRTTEMVEKANVDEREYDFLYEDGEGFHFMEPTTYEQLVATPDVVGEDKVFLTDGIKVYLKTFERVVSAKQIFHCTAHHMVNTGHSVGTWRAFVKYKRFSSIAVADAFFKNAFRFPHFQNLVFKCREIELLVFFILRHARDV